ncbi:glycoside hydrolase family 5 protein [Pontibacter beigongshangensis]|uniref:glycoside hydrolase family 5 protein n=1 Tax=Pontibacter beigongshangensis TaxID=2574733 RepID=UPI00164FE430|nr:glycoside hydrolase family 5 protein [Pontibacter beigongshangensis]
MKKNNLLFLLLVLLGFSCASAEQEGQQGLPALQVSGNVFTNSTGQTVRLEGVSFADPDKLESEGQWNREFFQEASNWGCNVVRFAIHPGAWRKRGPENYVALLDKGMQWATETNMYVILDWHSIGNLVEGKYPSANYATTWEETVDFWKMMAERYKGNTTAALFELYNEPTADKGELSWDTWKPVMEKLISEIKTVDDQKIFLVAGMDWAYLLDEVIEKPIDHANVAYVTHPYPQKRSQPWESKWEADWGKVADHYPIVATEFGFVGEGERGEHIPVVGDEVYAEAIINYFDKKGVSYTVWCFDPSWSPAMLEDFNFTPSRQGRFFKKVLQRNL